MGSRFDIAVATDKLRAESVKLREHAIRTRIQAAQTFCDLVETQVSLGLFEKAERGMGKVWYSIEETRRHIDEPGHISSTAAKELKRPLAILEAKARNVAKRLETVR